MEGILRNLIAAAAICGAGVYGGASYTKYTIQQQTGLTKENNAWVLKNKDVTVPVEKAIKSYQTIVKVENILDGFKGESPLDRLLEQK